MSKSVVQGVYYALFPQVSTLLDPRLIDSSKVFKSANFSTETELFAAGLNVQEPRIVLYLSSPIVDYSI